MISEKQQGFLDNLQKRADLVLSFIPEENRKRAQKTYQLLMDELFELLKNEDRRKATQVNKRITRLMNLYKMHPWQKPLPFPILREENESPEDYLDRIYEDYYEGEKINGRW